jgi:cell division protein FtsB
MEASMTEGRARRISSFRLILTVVVGTVILYLGYGFVRQTGVSHQRREELGQIERDIAVAQQKNAQLEQDLTYVQSTEAAEEWARSNGWAKEDEVSVVVVAPSGALSDDEELEPAQGVKPRSNREAWWDLFFEER